MVDAESHGIADGGFGITHDVAAFHAVLGELVIAPDVFDQIGGRGSTARVPTFAGTGTSTHIHGNVSVVTDCIVITDPNLNRPLTVTVIADGAGRHGDAELDVGPGALTGIFEGQNESVIFIGVVLFKVLKAVLKDFIHVFCGQKFRQLDGQLVARVDIRRSIQITVADSDGKRIAVAVLYLRLAGADQDAQTAIAAAAVEVIAVGQDDRGACQQFQILRLGHILVFRAAYAAAGNDRNGIIRDIIICVPRAIGVRSADYSARRERASVVAKNGRRSQSFSHHELTDKHCADQDHGHEPVKMLPFHPLTSQNY